jgi:hypothetical protein
MPTRWENAPFLGNGLIGALIFVSPDSTSLDIALSRSDVGRLDYPGGFRVPMRTQIGSLRMEIDG